MIRNITLATCCLAGAGTLWPSVALAQRAVPRPPSRPVPVYGHGSYVRPGYPYRSYYYPAHYYYSPFYFSLGWYGWYGSYGWPYYAGYYPSYGYGYYPQYGPYPPYGGYYPRYEAAVDLRVQVTPRHAEVYLDGNLVGRVDDFDGTWQRLRVPYGEHEIAVYLEGYQTIHQKMYFRPGESYKIQQPMRQLPAGEATEPRPVPSEPPPDRGERGGAVRPGYPPDRAPERGGPPAGRDDRSAFGTLSIRVQPGDAEVLVDGEKWEMPRGESRILVELAEGSHRVEIRKEGFRTYTT